MKVDFNKYKKVIKDFSLNILASFVITAVTQIIIYPWLAKEYDSLMYGIILAIMGVGNTIVSSVGGSINNARLLMLTDYEENNEEGDFIPSLLLLELLAAVLFLFYIHHADKDLSVLTVVLLITYLILGNARGYGMVAYRIKLNFKNNLICSVAIAVGNIIGVLIIAFSHKTSLWPITFVLGEVFGIIALLCNSNIFFESFRFTKLLSKTAGKIAILLVTTLIANILIYLDRMLLLPVLGGEAVSIYTTASFFGKCLGLLLTPMASVLLSYYAQSDYSMTKAKFRKTNLAVGGFGSAFFMVAIIFSKWFTGLLYPTLIQSAAPYLLIANLTAIIASTGNMTQPAVLKYAPIHYQVITQLAYCLVYIGGGYYGSIRNGLWGFAIAALFAACFRLLLLYLIGEIFINDRKRI